MFEWLLTRVFPTALKMNGDGVPEVRRWKVFGVGYLPFVDKAPAIYIHKFMADDTRPHHDHACWFLSVGLKGRYLEHVFSGTEVPKLVEWSAPWVRVWHKRTHRITMYPNEVCWTIAFALLNKEGNHI